MSDRRTVKDFDKGREIKAARYGRAAGAVRHPGDLIPYGGDDEITADEAARLWVQGTVIYADDFRPTPQAAKPAVEPETETPAAKAGKPAKNAGPADDKGAGDPPHS